MGLSAGIASYLGLRQPWGTVGLQSTFMQHLDDLGNTRLNLYGEADVRLFTGFSFNVNNVVNPRFRNF